jgi:hypothetical protein
LHKITPGSARPTSSIHAAKVTRHTQKRAG